MAGRISTHVRGNVVGYMALFVALSGTAWAASELSKNDVTSRHIKNKSVKTKDLAKRAVKTKNLARRTVKGKKVAEGTLGAEHFADGELPAGPEGPQGPEGPRGPQGAAGADAPVPSCPSGTTLVDAVCIETQIRAADEDYSDAEAECLAESRRLPTVGELQSLFLEGFAIGRSGGAANELTSSAQLFNNGATEFWSQVVNDDGRTLVFVQVGTARPFRCVATT